MVAGNWVGGVGEEYLPGFGLVGGRPIGFRETGVQL